MDKHATAGRSVAGKGGLEGRDALLRALQNVSQETLSENEAFLVVLNIADTKAYDRIIGIFGYKFGDDILDVRLASLDFLPPETVLYNIGFWSIGFILRPSSYDNVKVFLDETVDVHKIFLGKLAAKFDEPVICRGIPIAIKSGIGICDLKKGLGAAQDLLQATFIAGQVGRRAKIGWRECNYDLAEDNRRAFSIISDAAHSLSNTKEFELCYQPRIDVKSGHCIGAEALLRWRHPVLGLIPPSEFVPLIEMTGLIRDLTNWVLGQAIWRAVKWQNSGLNLKVAVNVSPKNFDEADFIERVMNLLAHFELDPKRLELEFSESIPFTDFVAANVKVKALRDSGVNVAIDDFGTGQYSFAYLQTSPANILKIDQSLLPGLKGAAQKQSVVKSLIAMAHDVGMEVVAEGVESMEMLGLLSAWGCDFAQGYYISRPMYADEFLAWHKNQVR